MRTLQSIISVAAESLRQLLEEAFEAGRVTGREEAALDLRAKIDGVLSTAPKSPAPVKPVAPKASSKRASSGSVKPTIGEMIENAANGLTADEIGAATNFKPNSIRGTLWTLGNEGLAVKRDGRWFPVRKAQKETTTPGAADSHAVS